MPNAVPPPPALPEAFMHTDRSHAEQMKPDPIQTVYLIAEAVEHLAETLPPGQDGLSYLLSLVGRDARKQVSAMEDAEKEK